MNDSIYNKLRTLSQVGWVIQITASKNYFFVTMKKGLCSVKTSAPQLDVAVINAYSIATEEYYL